MDAIVKISGLKESQLLFGRFGMQFFIAVCWWIFQKPKGCHNWYGGEPYIVNIWTLGVMFCINVVCAWYAYIRLPIGGATCIYYQSLEHYLHGAFLLY